MEKSDNFIFHYLNIEILKRINFDLSKVLDPYGNNILHYAVFQHNVHLVSAIINKARLEGTVKELINHRNIDGTAPVGMAFLFPQANNLAAIEIAKIFISAVEYHIDDYLNNKKYMDYSSVKEIGGTNLLHNVILAASKCKTKEAKQVLSEYFKKLSARILNEQTEEVHPFNPNAPTMNPGKLGEDLDGHMISTNKLLQSLKFSSKKIQQLCIKYFSSLLQIYEAGQYDDSSGDSEDEQSPAYKYKEILQGFDSFIKASIPIHKDFSTLPSEDGNYQRTFDKYTSEFSLLSQSLLSHSKNDSGNFDEQGWGYFWKEINVTVEDSDKEPAQSINSYSGALNSMVVPLFHGVPFMHSQYSNHQRREIVKKIALINKKLLARHSSVTSQQEDILTKEEEILIGIHTRTATSSCGMKSLYDFITASKEDLANLDKVDNQLQRYLTLNRQAKNFKTAMGKFVFDFKDSPIKHFWENIQDGVLPDKDIVKYRFPVIATSKAPDHAIRFAMGRNVEGNRGETPMQPEYDEDGYPSHRIAGLLYITLHKLTDLVGGLKNGDIIDVNREVKLGKIKEGRGFFMFSEQLECDFLGKIASDKIVAVLPIFYPHIRDSVENTHHLKTVYSIFSPGKKLLTSPGKLKKDLSKDPNPDIIEGSNISGFGKVIVPSIAGLANGIITSIAAIKDWFLCSITDNNELIPYSVNFDKINHQFTKAQLAIKRQEKDVLSSERIWEHVIKELIAESVNELINNGVNTYFAQLALAGENNEAQQFEHKHP